jgi:serine/threonine protein kinase
MSGTPEGKEPTLAELLLRLRADQLQRWQQGERPRLETYLEQYPLLRQHPEALLDLISSELLLRGQGGELPQLEEYLKRFPAHEAALRQHFLLFQQMREQKRTRSTQAAPVSLGDITLPDRGQAASTPSAVLPAVPGYDIFRELGRGNMGVVYHAYHRSLEMEVALKLPHAYLMADRHSRERFAREAQAAARLHHPNLCRVLEVGDWEGRPYLAMAYVPGQSLALAPPHHPAAVVALVHTLALALAEAHRLGVVHRDLKPSNILITPRGEPVVTDFGLALRLDAGEERLTQAGAVMGTPHYMAPEQARGDLQAMGPSCDIYSLGVILYELLTGQVPFSASGVMALLSQVLFQDPVPPRQLRPEIDGRLEAVCLKALAKRPEHRFASMEELAEALRGHLQDSQPSTLKTTVIPAPLPGQRVLVRLVRFAFAGLGERAPHFTTPGDRLYLDVGNDLRPGVIDRHNRTVSRASTTSLVLAHPELVDAAVVRQRRAEAPFVLVLPERPDLDAIASAYLASAYLTTGRFPAGAEALGRYLDQVDAGRVGMSGSRPCSLYTAFVQLIGKLHRRTWNSEHERHQETVRRGMRLIEYVLSRTTQHGTPVAEVDALGCYDLFEESDRQEIVQDRERYVQALLNPRTRARRAMLRLPDRAGGTVEVETLLLHDLHHLEVGAHCVFFRDWARTDTEHSRLGQGFVALMVFRPEGAGQARRCILSLRPDSPASLEGLGLLLEQAESVRRREIYGVDDRVTDPTSGEILPPRPGYDNADPWYDGRAHEHTLVDSPRSGTLLRAEEIEALLLHFGRCREEPEPLAGRS